MRSIPSTLLFAAALTLIACGAAGTGDADRETGPGPAVPTAREDALAPSYPAASTDGESSVAIFAGGCFWCMESVFDLTPGVRAAVSGYIGGPELSPTYKQVSSGRTGHTEAVRVVFDPTKVTYDQLLDLFWTNIDPFRKNAQFCDRGSQYRAGIFPLDADQRAAAHRTKAEVTERLGDEVVTEITDAGVFWTAESYHQDFHITNSVHYQRYRLGCGRDRRLEEVWGDAAKH
jgi:peptide-methionine (S)-S-oxide reductase